MPEKPHLWERIGVLRDEVLGVADLGERDSAGGEVFDAIVRWLMSQGETNPGLDLTLHEAINQRLAWGDPEGVVHTRRFVTRDEMAGLRFKPDSLPDVAWGTGPGYDPLELLAR